MVDRDWKSGKKNKMLAKIGKMVNKLLAESRKWVKKLLQHPGKMVISVI